jgi:hypothetical protein
MGHVRDKTAPLGFYQDAACPNDGYSAFGRGDAAAVFVNQQGAAQFLRQVNGGTLAFIKSRDGANVPRRPVLQPFLGSNRTR